MKGVIVAKAGGPFEVVDTIELPRPGPKEILIKSLVTGINPMENFMQNGLLVEGWPIVLGCDASGIVTEVGEGVTKFKVGDGVFGCTRLGFPGYMTFQEYFLMDEPLAFKRPHNVSVEHAATVGVAALTACLGLISGAHLELPESGAAEHKTTEWLIVLGGASAVGQLVVQIAKLNGYKVLASCSPYNDELVKKLGADATFNYKDPLASQLAEIESITKGNFSRVFDASAQAADIAFESLSTISKVHQRYFATTNDWSSMDVRPNIETSRIKLGQLGHTDNAVALEVNNAIASFIPKLEKLLESGTLKPLDYFVAGEGFEGVLEGLKVLNGGGGKGKKIVVRLQSD